MDNRENYIYILNSIYNQLKSHKISLLYLQFAFLYLHLS